MTASLEHQFNDHHFCGDWCKYINIPEEQWNSMNAADDYKLQNKIFDEHIYNEAKEIMIFLLPIEICIC